MLLLMRWLMIGRLAHQLLQVVAGTNVAHTAEFDYPCYLCQW
jgi:hypothetical protein